MRRFMLVLTFLLAGVISAQPTPPQAPAATPPAEVKREAVDAVQARSAAAAAKVAQLKGSLANGFAANAAGQKLAGRIAAAERERDAARATGTPQERLDSGKALLAVKKEWATAVDAVLAADPALKQAEADAKALAAEAAQVSQRYAEYARYLETEQRAQAAKAAAAARAAQLAARDRDTPEITVNELSITGAKHEGQRVKMVACRFYEPSNSNYVHLLPGASPDETTPPGVQTTSRWMSFSVYDSHQKYFAKLFCEKAVWAEALVKLDHSSVINVYGTVTKLKGEDNWGIVCDRIAYTGGRNPPGAAAAAKPTPATPTPAGPVAGSGLPAAPSAKPFLPAEPPDAAGTPPKKKVYFLAEGRGMFLSPWAVLRGQMTGGVDQLDDTQVFNAMICQENGIAPFADGFVTPTAANKQAFRTWFNTASARGPGMLPEKLPDVLRSRPDVLWLILGDYDAKSADAIMAEVRKINADKRTRINVTAMGGLENRLAAQLAQQSGGVVRDLTPLIDAAQGR